MNKKTKQIFIDVANDWKEQVRDMDDDELNEDRSEWIKVYGRDDDIEFTNLTGTDLVNSYDTDIHTLAIEVEQLSRTDKIIYDKKTMKVDENIIGDIDASKVGTAFAFFCLSKLDTDTLQDRLYDFRDMFREVILHKAKTDLPMSNTDDEITNQHKDIETTKEIDKVTARGVLDIEMMIDKLHLNKKDWVKHLWL